MTSLPFYSDLEDALAMGTAALRAAKARYDELAAAFEALAAEHARIIASSREQVLVRILPDESRAFLPRLKTIVSTREGINQYVLDFEWTHRPEPRPRSARIYGTFLDDTDAEEASKVCRRVFVGERDFYASCEAMYRWGKR